MGWKLNKVGRKMGQVVEHLIKDRGSKGSGGESVNKREKGGRRRGSSLHWFF